MKLNKILLATAASALLTTSAFAADNATLNVSANIAAVCDNVTASTMAFGTYNPLSGSADNQTSTISVTCTTGSPYQIALSAGGSGSVSSRELSDGGSGTLSYNLYQNSGHTTLWGATPGTNTNGGTGNGSAQPYTVYGEIAANQTSAPEGNYTDSVNVTIDY